jgi:DNA-binding NarL/FixJ family response regulator
MNILIVDDHPLLQEILRSVAREVFEDPRIDTANSFAEAVEKACAAMPSTWCCWISACPTAAASTR